MNGCGSSSVNLGSGCQFGQHFVDQRPKWENQIVSRKTKIIRSDKRKRKRKYF